MNWRLEIKTFFADMVTAAIPEIKYFGSYNNQKTNPDQEETRPELGVWFEYSEIGDGIEYLLQRDMQQADRVPVEVVLHIVFNNYNEQHQDLAYDYADKLTCEIKGRKHEKVHGRIMKSFEREDINHRSVYEYQIGFAFQIKEAVFNDDLTVDGNPETIINPNPGGRTTKYEPIPVLLKKP